MKTYLIMYVNSVDSTGEITVTADSKDEAKKKAKAKLGREIYRIINIRETNLTEDFPSNIVSTFLVLDKINEDYLLTAAIPGGPWGSDRFEMDVLSNYFDFINMMSYDLNSSTFGTHHTALYKSDILSATVNGCSVDETLALWVSKGVPASKICLGIAFYGKDIKTRANSKDGIGQSAVTGASYYNSEYTKSVFLIAYWR